MDTEIRPSAASPLAPHRRFLPIPKRPSGEIGTNLRDVLPIWGHLALLLAVIRVYHVEGRALLVLTSIALASLPIHFLLADRWKKGFFLAVSVVGLFAVFGVVAGLVVSALAMGFIGLCRLPIAWSARAGLVALATTALGFARVSTGSIPPLADLADVAWPVLGSMLMFRMILYLYEIKHTDKPEPLVDTLSYFFLLPNYAFMLFPVVDYRTFKRGFLAGGLRETQAIGLKMITDGVVQLLAYRVVYHELLIPFEEVHNPATLAAYLTCNYLLYLRVSGQFHIACGMLHLFGYRLPTTHNNYLLATGFTDYWRRINIYWKDFMIRVVFNPVAFRLKRRPRWVTLSAATTTVFLATWFLHGYQMFWLKGSWGFSVPDALFWGVLGMLVLVNVQLDARETPRKPGRPGGLALAVRAGKTAATFATIALLWSLWSSPSLSAWIAMFRRAFAG